MEAVVHDPVPCFLTPGLQARQQVVLHRQHKVDVHGGAPRQRSSLATAAARRVGGGGVLGCGHAALQQTTPPRSCGGVLGKERRPCSLHPTAPSSPFEALT